MRGVPHVLGLRVSVASPQGPRTGWSGDGAPADGSLRAFATGAVIQHFTKTARPRRRRRLPPPHRGRARRARGVPALARAPAGPRAAARAQGHGAEARAGDLPRQRSRQVQRLPRQRRGELAPPATTRTSTPASRTCPISRRGSPASACRATTASAGRETAPSTRRRSSRRPTPARSSTTTRSRRSKGAVGFYNGQSFNNSPSGRFLASTDPNRIGIRLDGTQVVAVAAFLRVINALENIRQSIELLRAARGARVLEARGGATRPAPGGKRDERQHQRARRRRAASGGGRASSSGRCA